MSLLSIARLESNCACVAFSACHALKSSSGQAHVSVHQTQGGTGLARAERAARAGARAVGPTPAPRAACIQSGCASAGVVRASARRSSASRRLVRRRCTSSATASAARLCGWTGWVDSLSLDAPVGSRPGSDEDASRCSTHRRSCRGCLFTGAVAGDAFAAVSCCRVRLPAGRPLYQETPLQL